MRLEYELKARPRAFRKGMTALENGLAAASTASERFDLFMVIVNIVCAFTPGQEFHLSCFSLVIVIPSFRG